MSTVTCKKCGGEMTFIENRKVGFESYAMYKCPKCNRIVAQ